MAGLRRDLMRETQEFAAMRDALRRAVAPDRREVTSARERSGRGPRLQCPVHGSVEVVDGEERCPVVVLETVAGEVKTSQCGEPLAAGA